MGCVGQVGPDAYNAWRALSAVLPPSTPAMNVNPDPAAARDRVSPGADGASVARELYARGGKPWTGVPSAQGRSRDAALPASGQGGRRQRGEGDERHPQPAEVVPEAPAAGAGVSGPGYGSRPSLSHRSGGAPRSPARRFRPLRCSPQRRSPAPCLAADPLRPPMPRLPRRTLR